MKAQGDSLGAPVRSGGQILVEQLVRCGVDLAFCVPGESFLPVLDALLDSPIRLVTCRHEAAAANMADAYGKLTGRPGVCLVSRGPGAAHAAIGVHTAAQDSTPVVLLIGDIPTGDRGREAFQEMDYRQFFGGVAKWVGEADHVKAIPQVVARAFATAASGRPGPTVVVLPEDVLYGQTAVEDSRLAAAEHASAPPSIRELAERLSACERPLSIIGGSGWTAQAAENLRVFLEANRIPACSAFRRQDAISHDSPAYIGELGFSASPELVERVRAADLVLVVGGRLDEMTTAGFSLLEAPRPRQQLIHVHPAPEELAGVYQPTLTIVSRPEPFAEAVRELRLPAPVWADWSCQGREQFLRWSTPPVSRLGQDDVDLAKVIEVLRKRIPDAIVANGAGNFSGWIHRFWRFRSFPSQLAPTSGAMGYGIPAAIAAKAVHPGRIALCIAGDGDFLMSGQELATAVQHGLPILVVVVNNGMYGTIRMHQERNFPGRVIGTDLVNPDFAAYARSFGFHGETVSRMDEFDGALERALKAGGGALIELRVDPESITARATLSEIRAEAIKERSGGR